MYTVELWAQGAGFARFLQARLPGAVGDRLRLGPGAQRADLVVAAPDLAALPPNPAPCRALLLPGHLASLAGGIPAAWVVSYGLTRRDTLTFSSLAQDTLCLALQRELVTLGGVCREPQEIPLAPRAGPTPWPCWPGQGPSSSWGPRRRASRAPDDLPGKKGAPLLQT